MVRTTILLCVLGLSGCATLKQDTSTTKKTPELAEIESNSSELFPGYIPPETIEEALRRGDSALAAGEEQKALFELAHGAQLEGDTSFLLLRIAEIKYNLGELRAAVRAALTSLEENPDQIRANELAGTCYLNMKGYEYAERHFLKAIEIDSQRGEDKPDAKSPFRAYTGMGIISDLRSDFDNSVRYFSDALKIRSRSPEALTNLGYTYYLQGEWNAAGGYYKNALRRDPQYVPAWRNLGLLYAMRGEQLKAKKAFLRIQPQHEALNDLGYIELIKGDSKKAREYFEAAIEAAPYYYETAYKNLRSVDIELEG